MAAGKKLKILRGRPGHYEMHERERVAPDQDKKARESIQPHIVLQRYPAFAIAREKLAAGYDFDIDPEDYLIKVFLKAPITEEDHRKMIVEGKLAVGDKQGAAREQAKIRAPIANRALNVVSRTTKMGCYSFNLPAGPPSSGGTCPAAGLGFMFMNSAELKKQQRALREPRQISVPDFICNGCVVGGTRVLIRGRGLVEVSKLEQEAQLFEVWSGKAWRSARAVFTGFKPVFELTTSWGSKLQLTADHQVLTEDRGWVEARDLEEGDRLVFEPPNAHHVPPASINFMDENDHHNARPTAFPNVWSAEVGAVLGYLLGDGSVTQGRYPSVAAVFAEKDVDAAQLLQKIVNRWVDTETQLRRFEESQNANDLTGEITSIQYGLHWRVKGLAEFLTHLGIDKSVGCDNLRAPSRLWEAGSDAVRGFLSGLFGSDGSVGSSGQKIEVSLASTSSGLLGDVQQMLFSFFGIRSTMTTYSSNEKRGYKPLFKLCINSDHHVRKFATDVGFFTPRKQSLLLKLCEAVPEAATPRRLPTVKSLEKVSDLSVPVFDLQVDTDHAFVANNVTIHNCYALKNSYGNPSQVMFQAVRYMLTLQWLEQGTFVPRMVDAINAARSVSVRALRGLPKHLHWTVPHPNFFRIHDSGDFVTPEYTRAWFEICQRLPDVHFWSPTRMWATSKGSSTVFEKGVPKNLALRPSAMHFAEPAPIPPKSLLKKVSAGSGSGKVTPPGAWRCPAYEHVSTGGGLGPKLTGAGEEKKFPALRWSAVSAQGKKKSGSATTEEEVRAIMQKRGLTLVSVTAHPLAGQVSEAEGTCGRAHGPNSPFRGGSDLRDTPDQGYGCRACWLSRDTPIFYQEH